MKFGGEKMNNSQIPMARHEGLVVQEMPEEVLVYDTNANKAHCLNQTAALVWKACDGKNSVSDIVNNLEKEFNAPVPEDLVWLAIDQLSKDNLLESEVKTKFEGVSRREVIKKIGFASLVALPVIGMLSFPQAALAVGCAVSRAGTCGGCASGQICCASGGTGTCQPSGTCAGTACP